jgi:hypothetical protein
MTCQLQSQTDQIKKQLECGICFEVMEYPMTCSPCTHTFCNKCLYRHIPTQYDDELDITCPLRCNLDQISHNTTLDALTRMFTQPIEQLNIQEYLQEMNGLIENVKDMNNREPCDECDTIRDCIKANHTRLKCTFCKKVFKEDQTQAQTQKCGCCDKPTCTTCTLELTSNIDDTYKKYIPKLKKDNYWIANRHIQETIEQYMKNESLTINDIIKEGISIHNTLNYKYGGYCYKCFNDIIYDYMYDYFHNRKDVFQPNRHKCWYGKECKTQVHNYEHASKLNHMCENGRSITDQLYEDSVLSDYSSESSDDYDEEEESEEEESVDVEIANELPLINENNNSNPLFNTMDTE